MNFKALSFGAVLGFLVAVVPSCGSPTCGPQNCAGCCDSDNKCVPAAASSSAAACGRQGNTCANCAAMNQVCNPTSFTCEVATGTGGGSGGGNAMGGGSGGGNAMGGGSGGGNAMGGGSGGGNAMGGGSGGGGGAMGMACNLSATGGDCPTGQSCMRTGNGQTTICFAGECDLVTQNCPTATDTCTYVGFPDGGIGRGCLPAGTVMEGGACSQQAPCGKGLICANGTCAKLCYVDSNCSNGARCAAGGMVQGSPEIATTCVTFQACDPLAPACPQGQGCYLDQNMSAVCVTAGTVPVNGTCGQANCVPGSLCLLPSAGATSGTCKSFCNLDGGMPNCGGAACQGLQGVPYGACP